MGAQAMVLAAGRGERMRPLTDTCPKPLLEVRGKPLLLYHLEALARGGVTEAVVNTAWLGEQIEERLGPEAGGLRITYSREGRDFGEALETAGGILRALPLLDEVFWLVAGDVYAPGFTFSAEAMEKFARTGKAAHLFLVPNPAHNPKGDFGLGAEGVALSQAAVRFTYSTIALMRKGAGAVPQPAKGPSPATSLQAKGLFTHLAAGNPAGLKLPLAPLLRQAMGRGEVTAELYTGEWVDVGTPERLAALNAP